MMVVRRIIRDIVKLGALGLCCLLIACVTTDEGNVVQVKEVSHTDMQGLDEETLSKLEEIKEARSPEKDSSQLKGVITATPNYDVAEYLASNPGVNNPSLQDYRVGGYDVLDIVVYEEADLSREAVPVSSDGYISFPLLGRVKVDGLNTSQIEKEISTKLAEGQYLLDAHVSVTVREYKSKQFMVLGSVKEPGNYPLQARERLLDAISKAGGIDFEQGGKQGMVIRTLDPDMAGERKIVIRIDLAELLKGGDQDSNLLLFDRDLLYIPKAENFYIIGEVKEPGSYPYLEKQITLVEAISKAGGFTPIAARNRTRIVRMQDGAEKIIEVRVDAITNAGQKGKDVLILPGDVIVVPESFF